MQNELLTVNRDSGLGHPVTSLGAVVLEQAYV